MKRALGVILVILATITYPGTASSQAPAPPPAMMDSCADWKSNPLVVRMRRKNAALTDDEVASSTKYWLDQNFWATTDAIQCGRIATPDADIKQDWLTALQAQLAAQQSKVAPGDYSINLLQHDACFTGAANTTCGTRLGGFAVAAWARSASRSCGATLDKYGRTKEAAFRVGFLDWWHAQVDTGDKCETPMRPARCIIGYCWGGDGYKNGIAFRPATELGGSLGRGLGFSDVNGGASFQFTGSVGARLFFLDDALDVHASFGVATATATSSSGTGTAGSAGQSHGFFVLAPGVGIWNGLFSVNYIHTMDPFAGQGSGNGVGIFADTAAIERFLGR